MSKVRFERAQMVEAFEGKPVPGLKFIVSYTGSCDTAVKVEAFNADDAIKRADAALEKFGRWHTKEKRGVRQSWGSGSFRALIVDDRETPKAVEETGVKISKRRKGVKISKRKKGVKISKRTGLPVRAYKRKK